MLIHKRTMGVLDFIWTGRSDARGPIYHAATLADVDNPSEWWEVPRSSKIGKCARKYYPYLEAFEDADGILQDIRPAHDNVATDEDLGRKRLIKELQAEAVRRGYVRRGKVRPKGLMPFLK